MQYEFNIGIPLLKPPFGPKHCCLKWRMTLILYGRAIPDVNTKGCKRRGEKPPETRTFCYVFKEVNNQDVFVSRIPA